MPENMSPFWIVTCSRRSKRSYRSNNVERQLKLKGPRSLLAGRIFDDRGNRMMPSHTVKKGVRYRYYVSSAIQQKRDDKVGSVSRVPAVEIEELVLQTLQTQHSAQVSSEPDANTDWLAGLERVVLAPDAIRIQITKSLLDAEQQDPIVVSVPWSPQKFISVKGISQNGADERPSMTTENSEIDNCRNREGARYGSTNWLVGHTTVEDI